MVISFREPMTDYITCSICGIDDSELLLVKNTYNVVRCRRCDLVYLNPQPAEDELAGIYSSEYYHFSSCDDQQRKKKLRKWVRRLRLIEKFANPGKILDVGCSTGLFLEVARRSGWEVYGTDISDEAVDYARRNYDVNVVAGTLQLVNFRSEYFDVITFFDSLEHMPDPLDSLEKANAMLKQDGLMVITTPNIGGMFPKLTYLFLAKTLGIWQHPTPPGHLYEFSVNTIQKLLKKAGFEVLGVLSEEIPVRYTVGKLENSVIDSMRGINEDGNRQFRDIRPQKEGIRCFSSSELMHNESGLMVRAVRKAARLAIKANCYMLVCLIYPIARWLKQGNSMLVITKKAS